MVTGNVTDIIIDCAHDDWTFIDGTKTAGTIAAPKYGAFPTTPPATTPNPYTNTPGGRDLAAGWTDHNGNLWLFGGLGWELSGNTQPDTSNAVMNDLWLCQLNFSGTILDQCQWQLVNGYAPAGVGPAIIANAQTEDQAGAYTNLGGPLPTPVPGARWGAATWVDNAGNLWLFAGQGNTDNANGLLNDLWMYNGTWTWKGGSKLVNQQGTYTSAPATLVPGACWAPVSWTDASGNFWLFGGFGYDATGTVGLLNDLWEYTGGNWIYVSGTTATNTNGAYGTQGTGSNRELSWRASRSRRLGRCQWKSLALRRRR